MAARSLFYGCIMSIPWIKYWFSHKPSRMKSVISKEYRQEHSRYGKQNRFKKDKGRQVYTELIVQYIWKM